MQGSFSDSSCITNVLLIESPNANYRAGHFATNKEGDIIKEYSSEDTDNLRIYYGLRKNGSYYFLNEPHTKKNILIILIIMMKYKKEDMNQIIYLFPYLRI